MNVNQLIIGQVSKWHTNTFLHIGLFYVSCNLKHTNFSLSRTLILSSPVLVEFRPWRGGAERCDMLPNIRSHAFSPCFTSNTRWRQRYFQDGRMPVIFVTIYESSFLPALRSLDINWHLCLGEWGRWTPLMQFYVVIIRVKTSRRYQKDVKPRIHWPHSCS